VVEPSERGFEKHAAKRRSWKGCKPNFVCPIHNGPGRESFVSAASTRNPLARERGRSEPPQGPLFGLAPDGVFHAPEFTLRAVGSYPAFSPLLEPQTDAWGLIQRFIFCGTIRRRAFKRHLPRVSCGHSAHAGSAGYAASRPVVFGLSSPATRDTRGQKRSSTLPRSGELYLRTVRRSSQSVKE
jgi:hypothetical protein